MDGNSNKSIKRKVVDQLMEGYEFATQLQHHLLSHQTRVVTGSSGDHHDDLDPVGELLAKILGSFHKTITVLDSSSDSAVSSDLSLPIEGSRNASCGDDSTALASDSGDSTRKRLGVVTKGKRGCYTRKKKSHTQTITSRRIEDRYAWRKYGQKLILNSKFPRSYFRCTHKQTKGCKATRQVQKQDQDPEMFQITYIGYHTCNADDQTQAKIEPFDHEINMDSDSTLAAIIGQGQVINANVQEQENNISSVTEVSAVKEENNNIVDQNKEYFEGSSGEDLSLVWQDPLMFDNQNNYYGGETSITSHQYAFIDPSLFDSYCAYEGTSAM